MKVELLNVKRIFNSKVILDIDRLELGSGKIYAVLGPNGSGKTTMLRIISGVDRGGEGEVLYNGVEKEQSSHIAYMPQSIYMFDMSVLQNAMLGIQKHGVSQNDAKDCAQEALDSVGMSSFINAKARSLSGGEAQRVAVARTLVLGKSIVLLDEPASATDILGMELIENYIKKVNQQSRSTIVFTTHNPSQAVRIADEIIFMYRGRIIEKGNPSSVFHSPQQKETKDFIKNWRI
jgi:ABC-type multidrug transport system ATPase subunit